ncbi:iron-siderophore ABC transporter substrate-binding protein [Thiospirochaeta perfilievii]|uniref:Iron-siderophore ABC transporter substrate-binding protein n=1 Tax=Thiospirochaeta perfilievii TaxID=252967 RepID=A0A5C1QD34_9SPIO|nr:iron-siderophore ABC transporter substrate-binding protein [Thiospirochaeta perfilievii]QEN05327.1 iron-siderophore ABC transporter substrate-binding protein [Thiospirochaeta perfilievii]
MLTRKRGIVILIFTVYISVSMFGRNQSESVEDIQPNREDKIVIEHAYGESIISKTPVRVATISWGNHDVPLALGITPVGISAANYGVTEGEKLHPWTKEVLDSMNSEDTTIYDDIAGLDYEAISDSNPDVILAAYSGITKEEYNLLSEIAPVIAYPKNPWQTLWREKTRLNSKAMGLELEGIELISRVEKLIESRTKKYPEIKDKSAAFFYFNPSDLGKFYIYTPVDARAAYLKDLGLHFPESISEKLDISSFAIELSSENVDILYDLDLIFTYGDGNLLEALKSDPLIGTIPAVANNAVVLIEDNSPLAASCTPSVLSIPWYIDDYLTLINSAAENVKW